MYCTNCGALIDDNAMVCSKCGDSCNEVIVQKRNKLEHFNKNVVDDVSDEEADC